jgi:hypothetical protein
VLTLTPFRVVLPNDALLRVECSRHVSVAALKDFLSIALLKASWDDPVSAQAFAPSGNLIRIAQHSPEASGKQGNVDARGAHAKLILVRSGVGERAHCVVQECRGSFGLTCFIVVQISTTKASSLMRHERWRYWSFK